MVWLVSHVAQDPWGGCGYIGYHLIVVSQPHELQTLKKSAIFCHFLALRVEEILNIRVPPERAIDARLKPMYPHPAHGS